MSSTCDEGTHDDEEDDGDDGDDHDKDERVDMMTSTCSYRFLCLSVRYVLRKLKMSQGVNSISDGIVQSLLKLSCCPNPQMVKKRDTSNILG